MIEIIHPIENETERQMNEIGVFLSLKNVPILNPVVFLSAWQIGKIKILIERQFEEIQELTIVSLIECPITGQIHHLMNYCSSENFKKKVLDLIK